MGAVLTQSPVAKQSFTKRTTWEQQISLFSHLSPHSFNNDLFKVRGLHIQQMCLSALYKSILPSLELNMCHLYVQEIPHPTGKLVSNSLPCHCQASEPWCSNISLHLLSLSLLITQTPHPLVQGEVAYI